MMPRDTCSSKTTHMPPRSTSAQHLSTDPASLPPPARAREGDSPECSAFLSMLEFQSEDMLQEWVIFAPVFI